MTGPEPRLPGELVLRCLIALMPRAFRERRGRDVLECHRDLWQAESGGWGAARRAGFWMGAVVSTAGVLAGRWWMALKGRLTGESDGDEEGSMGWETLIREAGRAVRRLARRPGFTGVVVLTLALGLGVNTAVFTVLHAVLLAPLPYAEGERLVRVYANRVDRPGEFEYLSLPTPATAELRDQVPALASVAILENQSPTGADLTGGERPERVRLLRVNAEYFATFGYGPVAGRVFGRAEEVADARIAVVSEDIWKRHLGGRPEAVGSSIVLDQEAYQVVGVMSDDVRDPLEGRIDVWLPLTLAGEDADYWGNNWLTAVGRLAPGASLESLRTQLDVLETRHQDLGEDAAEKGFNDVPLHEDVVGDSGPVLLAVMGAVAFLLLLTAVNVASLMLARAATRERELAIRTSLGSSRGALARQFILEAVFLALAGGAAGLALAVGSLDLILAVAPADLPMAERIHLSGAAVLFAGAGSAVLGLVLGVATALPFLRTDLRGLAAGTRGEGTGQGRPGLRAMLVRVEVALAVVLLAGAGILARSIHSLQTRDLGADPRGVLTFQVGLPEVRYGTDEDIYRFSQRFHEVVRALPGVESVAVTSRLPVTGSFNTFGSRRAYGPDRPWDTDNTSVNQRWVAGDYFEATGLALVRGRVFDATDEADAPYRTVVSEALADRLFGEEDPLGQWLYIAGRYTEIVGVVESEALTPRGDGALIAYHHQRQWISGSRKMTHVVRTAASTPAGTTALIPEIRSALSRVDPDLVLFGPAPLAEVIGRGIAQERFAATLLVVFAGLAAAVAGLGLFGVLSHLVGRRRHEIGIRMALGADRSGVVAMVLQRGLTLAATGAAAGIALAWLLGSALEFLVYGVSPRDPLAMTLAPGILLLVAVLASALPAVNATRVDPAAAFREE